MAYNIYSSKLFNISDLIKMHQGGVAYPVSFELSPVVDNRKSYYGKAIVVMWNDNKYLLSYNTPVAMVDKEGNFSRLWGGYSATTMRHVNSFHAAFANAPGGGKAWWDKLPVEQY